MTTAGGIAQNATGTPTVGLGYARGMARRARRGSRLFGERLAAAGAVALAAGVAGLVGTPAGHAQPAGDPVASPPANPAGDPAASSAASEAPPVTTLGSAAGAGSAAAVDLDRAKDLYRAAEAEMRYGKFAEAVRDYSASYELSRDPALLYKIGRANESAGKCDQAIGFYTRYVREGAPTPHFVATTRTRIQACGGDPDAAAAPALAPPPAPDATPAPSAGAGSGTPLGALSASHRAAWVTTGGALALVALGGVLAYAARSSENDVRDLYAGFNGSLVTFDAQTRKRYDDLVDQGRRYQHLSWAAFGAAGAAAIGAAALFVFGRHDASPADATHARLAPALAPTTDGVVGTVVGTF
ncbi:MAG TPA: hypothetical protein VFP84_01450 [Kofleriaceae bacterium]|nr:hypothetical protein [Kofleriaceae bacterium]